MRPIQILGAVLVPMIWGIQYAFIKAGLAVFPPLFFVGLRFAAVAAILLPFVGMPGRRERFLFALVSVFMGGLNFGLVFIGLQDTPAGVTGVANQLWSPFTLILAWPLLGERISVRTAVGVTVALCGVALAVADPSAPVPLVPTLLIVGSALALATGTVLVKRFGPFDPVKLMAWISLFTVPQVLTVSAIHETGQFASISAADITAWLAFAYTVLIGGIAGFILWFWLVARCSMARVAPFALLQAPFSILAGVVTRHEPLTASLAVGAAVCLAGVVITQRVPTRNTRPSSPLKARSELSS